MHDVFRSCHPPSSVRLPHRLRRPQREWQSRPRLPPPRSLENPRDSEVHSHPAVLIWTTLTQEEWKPRDWRVVCKSLDAMKNRVPPEMAAEIGAAMVAAVESRAQTLR